MRWTCPEERRCLKVSAWPEADQKLWADRVVGAEKKLSLSRTVNWRSSTIGKRRKGYGRWLSYLQSIDADLTAPACARVTPDRVLSYVAVLQTQNLARHTIRGRIEELLSVVLAFDRKSTWGWLNDILRELEVEAEDAKLHQLPEIFPADAIELCQRKFNEFLAQGFSPRRAVWARNAAMIMFLSMQPLRRTNLANLVLGKHIYRIGEQWRFRIPGAEMKGGKELSGDIPPMLGKVLDLYCSVVRPILLNGATSDQLWVTINGDPVSDARLYAEIRKSCKRWFGLDLSPHDFRSIVAQAVVAVDPGMLLGAQALLGHANQSTTTDYYIVSDGVRASRAQADLIHAIRRRFVDGGRSEHDRTQWMARSRKDIYEPNR